MESPHSFGISNDISKVDLEQEENNKKEEDEEKEEENEEEKDEVITQAPKLSGVLYKVTERPPVGIVVFTAFQMIFSSMSGSLGITFLIYLAVCPGDNSDVLVTLISTSLVCVGVTTFIQVTFGLRLPVIQGSSPTFLVPIMIMMQTDRWRCHDSPGVNGSYPLNGTDPAPHRLRLAEISGSLVLASCTQVLLGATGLIGILVRFIGPLTVTPLLSMIALSLAQIIVLTARAQWGITLLNAFLTIFFNVGLAKVQIPCLSWNGARGFHFVKIQAFRIFANIFALCICWLLCLALTLTDVFPDDPSNASYRARTDVKLEALGQAPWIFFPYPGQWGPLTFSATTTVAMLGAVLASMMESLGDYRVTAFTCQVPPPPKHAINRAVMMEGLGSILSGALGACHATTTYSDIAGYISYTGVASRLAWQFASIFYVIAGLVGKMGGVLALVPDPIIGGMQVVGSGMIFSSAIAALRSVNLELPRNLMVLGVSIIIGAAVPIYMEQTPRELKGESGVLEVIITNGPLLAAITGFLLDNMLPGSRKDRGFLDKNSADDQDIGNATKETKDTKDALLPEPKKSMDYVEGLEVYEFNYACCKNISWPKFLHYIPFIPLYRNSIFTNYFKKCRK